MERGPLQEKPTAVEVVAGALIAADGRVLMHRRRLGKQHGGLWEFPGGKVETGESRERALVRELEEELGITVATADLEAIAAVSDESPGGAVLFLYTITRWAGDPRCLDGEAIGWFTSDRAARLPTPPLDAPLLARLPEFVARALRR